MNIFLSLTTLLVADPAPKNTQYEVVYGICISTTKHISGYTKSTFAVTKQRKDADWQEGEQFDFEYMNGNRMYFSFPHNRFLLTPFEPGDASFMVVTRDSNKKIVAVSDVNVLRRDVLHDPYLLIHPLKEKESRGFFDNVVPDESDTLTLGAAVRIANHPEATDEVRQELIADAQKSRNKYVRSYIEWLLKKNEK